MSWLSKVFKKKHRQREQIAFTQREQIAFTRLEKSVFNIYIMNDDGSEETALIEGLDPSWSPDGEQLAISHTTGVSDVCLINIDGSGLKGLTSNWNPHHGDYDPCWSPDGKQIALSSEGGNYFNSIYVMNADGTGYRPLTNPKLNVNDRFPTWSPDGKQIAFSRSGTILVINLDGSGEAKLTTGTDPRWSPDGERILFSRHGYIYLLNNESSEESRLTDGKFPAWSADGKRIAFCRGKLEREDIWVMQADCTNQIQLTKHKSGNTNPSWSGVKILASKHNI